MKNFERIRNMSISELAEFLDEVNNTSEISNEVCTKLCEYAKVTDIFARECEHKECMYIKDVDMFEFWLQQEVIE